MTQPPSGLWSRALSARLSAFLIFACGACAAAGLQPSGLWSVTLVALALAFGFWQRTTRSKSAAFAAWLLGFGYFVVALRWILEPFQVEAEVFGWMAPFALLLMAGGLALFWAAAGAFAAWLGRDPGQRLWAFVLCLSGAELLRAYVFTGFPWAGLAQIWVNTPVAQTLAWVGPQGLGGITLALFALPVWLFGKHRLVAAGAVALVAFVAPFLMPEPSASVAETGPVVRLVQPNAPQDQKWDPEMAGVFFWRQVDATAAPATPRPDLIVWPETAIPTLLHLADAALAEVARAADGTPVVLGMQRAAEGGYFNAALVLDGDGQVRQVYDKHHLVPFGEYMPFRKMMARFGITGLAAQLGEGYTPGPGPALLDLGPLGKARPLICYEAVFPQHARAVDGVRPDFLLQLTNDAWFGTAAGPQQHLAQAQMRAIEQGLPMVRVANTGISAVIDANGRIVEALPLGVQGYLDVALPQAFAATFYAHTGDWLMATVILMLILSTAYCRLRL